MENRSVAGKAYQDLPTAAAISQDLRLDHVVSTEIKIECVINTLSGTKLGGGSWRPLHVSRHQRAGRRGGGKDRHTRFASQEQGHEEDKWTTTAVVGGNDTSDGGYEIALTPTFTGGKQIPIGKTRGSFCGVGVPR